MALTENSINYLHDFLENKHIVKQVGGTFSIICESLILSDFQDDNIENNKTADIIFLSNTIRSSENLKSKFLEIAEMMDFDVTSLRKDCLIINKTFYFFYSITQDGILNGRTNTICFLDNSIPMYKQDDIFEQNPHIDIRRN
jgi:hypothetical protein